VERFGVAKRSLWIDWNDIPKAVDFMEAIKKGICEANSFVYVISPDSVSSKVHHHTNRFCLNDPLHLTRFWFDSIVMQKWSMHYC
jgi:hypothetical protein